MVRRIVLTVGLLMLGLLAIDWAAWRWTEGLLQTGWDRWVADRRAEGWVIEAGVPDRAGWPLAATLVVPNITVSRTATGDPLDASWQAARLALTLRPRHPDRLALTATGSQSLRLGQAPMLSVLGEIDAWVSLQGMPIHVTAGQLDVAPIGAAATQRASLRGLDLQIAAPDGDSLGLTLHLATVSLPDVAGHTWPFGPAIDTVIVTGRISGLGRAETNKPADAPARAAAWRDRGGSAIVDNVSMTTGPVALAATGSLQLDQTLQPAGKATIRIVGYQQGLDALAASRWIRHDVALAAKALLGLIASAPNPGGAGVVDVPLTLQDRTLSVGGIPLALMPHVRWR